MGSRLGFARDLLGVAGAVSITWGCFLIYRPAGFIVGGTLLLAAAVLLARSGE